MAKSIHTDGNICFFWVLVYLSISMADRPKREVKRPNRFVDEFSSSPAPKKTKTNNKDKNLYEIVVTEVDKARKRLKIYYKGF